MRSSTILLLALAACKPNETDTVPGETDDSADSDVSVFTIDAFTMSPQGVAAGEPIAGAFSAPGALSCTVAFNGPLPDRSLTPAELAAGAFDLTLDAATIETLVQTAAVYPAAALFASLTCAGDAGQATAYAAVEVVGIPNISITAEPSSVPSSGGEITLCWSHASGGTCRITQDDGTELGADLASSGCLAPFEPDATRGYYVECCANDVCLNTNVYATRGPGISAFTVAPRVLPVPGTVTAAWDTIEMASCTLYHGDTAVETGTSGTVSVAVGDGTSSVHVRCVDATGTDFTAAHDVFVGPSIARFELLQLNAGEVFARWIAINAESCVLDLASGTKGWADAGRRCRTS